MPLSLVDPSWHPVLQKKETLIAMTLAQTEKKDRLPTHGQLFRALQLTPLTKVKVVILALEPYHTPGMGNGLAFGLNPEYKGPQNSIDIIRQEIKQDVGEVLQDTTLVDWAAQGVLLLNTRLSVRAGIPNSHCGRGWEHVVSHIVASVSQCPQHVVFLLWGRMVTDFSKDLVAVGESNSVLMANDPSTYTASHGFLGCKHFSQCNEILTKHGLAPVKWGEKL